MKLSIILPNYNYGHYLEEAVKSVAESSYPSFEIILIDDGSQDHSVSVAEKLALCYPQLRFYKNESNQGIFKTTERAVSLAKGEYLHFFSSDDYRLPGFIEKTMAVLDNHPALPLCCSDPIFENEGQRNAWKCTPLLEPIQKCCLFSSEDVYFFLRHSRFWIPGHTSIIKKEMYLKYGKFDSSLTYHCDWFLLHLIALKEGMAYLPERLAVMRCHSRSYSAEGKKHHAENSYKALLAFIERDKEIASLFRRSHLLLEMTNVLQPYFLSRPRYWNYFLPKLSRLVDRRLDKWFRASFKKRAVGKRIRRKGYVN